MKFKYTGDLPAKCMDLGLNGILEPSEVLVKGKVFEIPDENKVLIERVKVSGNYEVYKEPVVKRGRPKKEEKEDEKED